MTVISGLVEEGVLTVDGGAICNIAIGMAPDSQCAQPVAVRSVRGLIGSAASQSSDLIGLARLTVAAAHAAASACQNPTFLYSR